MSLEVDDVIDIDGDEYVVIAKSGDYVGLEKTNASNK